MVSQNPTVIPGDIWKKKLNYKTLGTTIKDK